MRELMIKSIGQDQYIVTSKKVKGKKEIKTDQYRVDMRSVICDCKGWFYSKHPKMCIHIKTVIALLKNKGVGILWDDKEQGYIILDNSVYTQE